MITLSIDPGLAKCGIALLEGTLVILKEIISRDQVVARIGDIKVKHKIFEIIVGEGTGSDSVLRELKGLSLPVKLVPENFSTFEARKLYFKDNPPKGIFRFLPVSMLFPPRPIDDYAAVVLGQRYLKS